MRIDLLERGALDRPHELFASLREQGPVVWSEAHQAWIVTDYPGVVEAFRDVTQLSSDRLTPFEQRLTRERRETLALAFDMLRGWMVFHNAPRHALLRDPVRQAFTPKRIGDLQPKIERIVADLLDDLGAVEEADFKKTFAFPVPAIVIAELLGVPAGDRERFKGWSKKLSAIVFGESGNVDQAAIAAEGSEEFYDYFRWLIGRRAQQPGDDLISALIAARASSDRPGLTDMEVVGACTLLLFAGHETTTNAIANATAALLQRPEQAAAMSASGQLELGVVDELLRFDGPVKIMVRSAAVDHVRGGQNIRRGDTVFLSVSGANHDPSVFPAPEKLDLDRPAGPGNVAFGQGPHFCLGHALARLEMSIALPRVFNLFPMMTLCDDEIDWDPLILVRSASALPVKFRP